jgi:dGTPase
VAQIARRIAEHLIEYHKNDKGLIEAAGGLDPDVVEAAALIHDIGHPPFGHITEKELNKILEKENSCFDGFEGNAQSFRVITALSIRSNGESGLNLTRATLNADLKYPWKKEPGAKKWGFYESEKKYFDFARELEPAGSIFKSLEAEIMDWSDDIAYSVHDVDDFCRAGLIPLDQLLLQTAERERFISFALAQLKEKYGLVMSVKDANNFFDSLQGYVPELTEPYSGSKAQRAALSSMATFLITRYVFGPKVISTEKKAKPISNKKTKKKKVKASVWKPITINKTLGERRVVLYKDIAVEIKFLKEVMSFYVFGNPALVGQQHGQRKVVRELFQIILESISDVKNKAALVPEPLNQYLNDAGNDHQLKLRIIADFISSLTEQQALFMHKRLIGLEPGSIRELIVR